MINQQHYQELLTEPVIGKAFIKKMLRCNDAYAYTTLSRLNKRGLLHQIQKGKYTAIDDIYLIASNLYPPSYICLWSAAAYKGFTEQILLDIQIAVTTRHPSITFNNYHIHPITYPKKLFFGFDKERLGEHNIFISSNEKLLIDALYFPHYMGNPQEIIKVFQNAQVDQEKLINYLQSIDNISLIKRCGFLLEHIREIDISDYVSIKDRNYIHLFHQKGRKSNTKWMIKHDL